jgi:hypothetical protein
MIDIDIESSIYEYETINCLLENYQKQLLMENIYQEGIGDERLDYRGTDNNGNKEHMFISILKFIGRLINNLIYRIKKFFKEGDDRKLVSETQKANELVMKEPEVVDQVIDKIVTSNDPQIEDSEVPKEVTNEIAELPKTGGKGKKILKAVKISAGIVACVLGVKVIADISNARKKDAEDLNELVEHTSRMSRVGSEYDKYFNDKEKKPSKQPEEDDIKKHATRDIGKYNALVYAIDTSKYPELNDCDMRSSMYLYGSEGNNANSTAGKIEFKTTDFEECFRKVDINKKIFDTILSFVENRDVTKLKNCDAAIKRGGESIITHARKPMEKSMDHKTFISNFNKLCYKINELMSISSKVEKALNPSGSNNDYLTSITNDKTNADALMNVVKYISNAMKYVNVLQQYTIFMKKIIIDLDKKILWK